LKPLVSILIPAFNAQEFIVETLRSAIAQTWKRKEIIVVEDGSTDQTLALARQFEAEGVRVVTQKNQGAAAARNVAFSLSKGDYIQWLDADDVLAPNKIAEQMEILKHRGSKRTLLSGPWAYFLYRHGRAKFISTPLWCDLTPVEWLLRKMERNLHMQTATWLVSRELTEAAGPWNRQLLGDDDGEYFCRVLLASDGVKFAPDAKVYYRLSGSASLSYIGQSERKMEAQWRSMELHIQYLRSLEDSERVRAACVQYLQNWLIFFYPDTLGIVHRAEVTAHNLGGELKTPDLRWKYAWIEAIFGWAFARRAQVLAQSARLSMRRSWDKALFRVQGGGLAGAPGR
jgi:glycosyltransferase involved in cell wall biosynthesis